MSTPERYLNLALINVGEAITELGNIRQRGATPGADCANVKLSLHRAMAALDGAIYVPPPIAPQHAPANKPVSVVESPVEPRVIEKSPNLAAPYGAAGLLGLGAPTA